MHFSFSLSPVLLPSPPRCILRALPDKPPYVNPTSLGSQPTTGATGSGKQLSIWILELARWPLAGNEDPVPGGRGLLTAPVIRL